MTPEETLLTAACTAVAKFYKEQGDLSNDEAFEEILSKALQHDKGLQETKELFLEKKTQYDNCSEAFKRLFKQLDKIDISCFPNSWVRINLTTENLVLVVNMKNIEVQPLVLLKQSDVLQIS